MEWFNQPPAWDDGGATITVHTAARTDFWRTTHYGFIRDSGHFYYRPVAGDFTAEVEVRGRYQDLYDQAGLMVRQDAHTWMKCGIEFVVRKRTKAEIEARGRWQRTSEQPSRELRIHLNQHRNDLQTLKQSNQTAPVFTDDSPL